MSFPVTLYLNLSASNVVDKELEERYQSGGTLREGTSIIDPVILIEGGETLFATNPINYIYVPIFNRYYYVTNIISVQNQLWEIHCHVDVLMSYKDNIRAQTAVVARQEGTYNMYLDDGIFMAYQNPLVQTKVFSNDSPFETQEFVLIVAGS